MVSNDVKHSGASMDELTLGHLLEGKGKDQLIVIESTKTVSEAMAQLASRKILSAPVVLLRDHEDQNDSDDDMGFERFPNGSATPIGFVDAGSLLGVFLDACPPNVDQIAELSELDNAALLGDLLKSAAERVSKMKVINAIAADGGLLRLDSKLVGPKGFGLSLRRLINTCFTSTLSDLVHHRVAVTDPDGSVSHIVSQSDIVRFFLKNEDTFGNMKDMNVSELRLGTKSVFTLPGGTPTFVAFMTLHSQKRTAAGVIDSDGKLIGNLSKSDLRGLSPENFSLLTRPLSVYFCMDSTPNGKENDVSGSSTHQPESPVSPKEQLRSNSLNFDKQKRQVFTARDTDTLESVLDAIISNRLHRLYVVDDDFRPTAVITLTDIIRLFANY
mmetsp:Transcript_17739/g.29824  ORF Transcript_17739/g.29824 Transcript_17739/m.29824 type:complete len:386 (-) Transcript_17739:223-1380(-)